MAISGDVSGRYQPDDLVSLCREIGDIAHSELWEDGSTDDLWARGAGYWRVWIYRAACKVVSLGMTLQLGPLTYAAEVVLLGIW